MNATSTLIAASILLPAVGLVIWAWHSLTRLQEDLRAFDRFEKAHFEIGPQATSFTEGTP